MRIRYICDAASLGKQLAGMSNSAIGLFVDIIRAGALLEGVVREAVAAEGLNDTDVWVLIAMSGQLGASAAQTQLPSTPALISAEFGFARARVSMSIKGLSKLKLVRPCSKAAGQDGRTRRYVLTAAGLRRVTRVIAELESREMDLRVESGIARNARKVDLQVVALGLSKLSTSRVEGLQGLDRRRVSVKRPHP